MGNRRISGKNGQIWLQVGETSVAGPTTCNGNAATEVVDGISYAAYQVWTLSVAGNIPMSPKTFPTVVVGGTGLPAAYTFEWNPLRGKLIFTPSLGASATVSMSAYATPKLYAQGDTVDFSFSATQDIIDASAQSQNWKTSVTGQYGWSGKCVAHWKSTAFWDASAGAAVDTPNVIRLYPAIGIFTEYWLGACFIDWGNKVEKSGVVSQDLTLQGTGPLIYFAS